MGEVSGRHASAFLLPEDTQRALVREAGRAPSVHNIQPARWRFESSGDVLLFRAVDRRLPIADPAGHDVALSLGAAFEGMSLALSRIGYTLGAPIEELRAQAVRCTPVVRAHVSRGGGVDLLAPFVDARRTYRGRFAPLPKTGANRAMLEALAAPDVRIVMEPADLAAIAAMHDDATWRFESQPRYHAELWSWLRLSRRDPRYRRDGLTADCLGLSALEREAARILLRPASFVLLARLGLARHLVAESAQVRSAAALLLFTPRATDTPFVAGRRLYRLWLEITATGLSAAPMSASADDPATRDELTRRYGIPSSHRLANVLRIGPPPSAGVPKSPRLPVTELLV